MFAADTTKTYWNFYPGSWTTNLATSHLTDFHAIEETLGNEVFYLQQDIQPHYHQDLRMYLDDSVPGQVKEILRSTKHSLQVYHL